MADITTIDDTILGSQARSNKRFANWQQRFYKPLTDATIRLWLQQQSPDVIRQLELTSPEAMANIKERLHG